MTLFEKLSKPEEQAEREEEFVFGEPSQDFYPEPGETSTVTCLEGNGSIFIGDDNQFPLSPGERYGGITSGNGWRVVPHPSTPLRVSVYTRQE